MRALILLAAAALTLAACKNNDQSDNTQNGDENHTAENIDSNDVTQEYVDLDSQVRNLEAAEVEMRQLMTTVRERMKKADDILQVYQHLTELRGQIEQAKGRMRYLSQMAALSTLKVAELMRERCKELVLALICLTQRFGRLPEPGFVLTQSLFRFPAFCDVQRIGDQPLLADRHVRQPAVADIGNGATLVALVDRQDARRQAGIAVVGEPHCGHRIASVGVGLEQRELLGRHLAIDHRDRQP